MDKRPDQPSLQTEVEGFALRRSPADVPANYDFHNLQIAFEHVWQEAIDAGVLAAASDAYHQIVELGGDASDGGCRPIAGILLAQSALMKALNQEPPPDVIQMFDVTKELWNVLDTNQQARLEQLAAAGMAQQTLDTPVSVINVWVRTGDEPDSGTTNTLYLYLSDQLSRWIGSNFVKGEEISCSLSAMPSGMRLKNVEYIEIRNVTVTERHKWLLASITLSAGGQVIYQNNSVNQWIDSGTGWKWRAEDFCSPTAAIPWREMGERILSYGRAKLASSVDDLTRLSRLVRDLENRLKEPYTFTVYAANRQEHSVNFGLLITYRQMWNPLNYQAGRLVKTVPLLPNEHRKFAKKTKVTKSRAEKEVENSLRVRKDESAETSRAESEIIRKARSNTNFNLTAQGSFNIGIASGDSTTSFDTQAETSSDETKKDFREAVLKASEEYKQERTVEVNTSLSEDTEAEESGEISNPNDEIPVTFLFYELQRRYLVSQRIHGVTPVILVAQEFPNPADIDDDWLLTHDWIIRRVILDDSFLPALSYLSTRIAGDEVALVELRKNVEDQRTLVKALQEQLVQIREQVGRRYTAMERAIDKRIGIIEEGGSEGALEKIGEFFVGDSDQSPEAAQARQDAARDAWERAARDARDLRAKIEREVTALNALTESYTKSLSDHLNRKTQIARLRVHVKQNIFYYMQAIWSHEPPDQRFFRLHKVRVPLFQAQSKSYRLSLEPRKGHLSGLPHRGEPTYHLDIGIEIKPPNLGQQGTDYITLAEAADLDTLLGFKGNYMIFPLKRPNPLTDFMMAPYRNDVLGLQDPDEFGNWTLDEFAKYVCCLNKRWPEKFEAVREELKAQYERLASDPRSVPDEVVVPTGSLFIEALPGAHPILEDFKLAHRAIDVKKVQAEVRKAELENVRLAARLVAAEYDDPDIDRRIVIGAGTEKVTVPIDSQ
ncbi:MAG: hypothetical protein NTW28_28110 [Candidatus Solibacter sp.]|nr:hypothetical protein [Candidatus Solibacter sp.]